MARNREICRLTTLSAEGLGLLAIDFFAACGTAISSASSKIICRQKIELTQSRPKLCNYCSKNDFINNKQLTPASWSSGNAFVSGAGGLRFKSQAGQIGHSVANSSPH